MSSFITRNGNCYPDDYFIKELAERSSHQIELMIERGRNIEKELLSINKNISCSIRNIDPLDFMNYLVGNFYDRGSEIYSKEHIKDAINTIPHKLSDLNISIIKLHIKIRRSRIYMDR